MNKLEITLDTDRYARGFDFSRPTFRAYLFTPTHDGRIILSEAHFVGGKNEVRPLGTYDPKMDTTPGVTSVTYRVEPIVADRLMSVREFVHRRNFPVDEL